MAIPIPLALSLVVTAANMAIETKITERKQPIMTIKPPVKVGSKNKIGIPQPMKNARHSETDKPENKLSQIFFLFKG